jgi:hypothetical protein
MVVAMKRMFRFLRMNYRKTDHRITRLIKHYKNIGTSFNWVYIFDKELGWYYLNNGDRRRCVDLYTNLNKNRHFVPEGCSFFSLQDSTEVHMVWSLMTTADKYCFYQEHIRNLR